MLVILDNIRSALNVGSIIRTCDALGIKDVYFCGITPDSSHKKVVKTSLGAERNIKPKEFNNTKEAIDSAKKIGYKIYGLELGEDTINIKDITLRDKVALVVGNEVSGISSDIQNECDEIVQIPMKGVKESLNVSVAFGIAAFELTK